MHKNETKHILVVSQYFYPEQFRINDICVEWIKRGYKVTVITGIPNYPQGRYFPGYGLFKKRREEYFGVEIRRLPLIPRGKSSITLVLNYFSFVISGLFWSFFSSLKSDTVFIFEVSPMTQALVGVWYSKRRKIPCIIYVQDLWPENVETMAGIKSKMILRAIGRMVDYIYSSCSKILTTSQSFVKAIAARGVHESKIAFWPQYAESFNTLKEQTEVPEIPMDGCFNIIFTGNIGNAQGLDILAEAASLLKQQNINVRFNIVGDGRFRPTFVQMVAELKVEKLFNFIQRQPAERIPSMLSTCDAAFLSLTDDSLFTMTIPAKLQTYMAVGIPIIAAADGETSNIIRDSKAGVCSPAGDAKKLAANIIDIMSKSKEELTQMADNGRNYCQKNFDKTILMNELDCYISQITGNTIKS